MPDPNPSATIPGRLNSIDALRGFDMFWIIGGGSFLRSLSDTFSSPISPILTTQLEHSQWNGFTFEDLIFPLFLFIVGLVMPFSLSKRVERGDKKSGLYKHILIRTILLFSLGLIYNFIPGFDFEGMRYAGVLQRIALCYCFASLVVMNFKISGQVLWFAGILVFYFAIMKFVPVPGLGAGILTPEGNLASYIDRLLLPGNFCCFEFGDNEGILSTIPAVSTTLMGVLAGHFLKSGYQNGRKTMLLITAGLISIACSLVWNIVFPVNKLLWSSSYVLLAGGLSLILTAVFYWVIDVRGYRKWAFPFVVIGLNPITIYLAQKILYIDYGFDIFSQSVINIFAADCRPFLFFFSIIILLVIKWLILYFLYRRKIFLKV